MSFSPSVKDTLVQMAEPVCNGNDGWTASTIYFIKTTDSRPCDKTFWIPFTEKTKMPQLAAQTKVGKYFPDVKVPQNLQAFVESMLAYGNSARLNPEFRKKTGSKYAVDLSGDDVDVYGRKERVFKDMPYPPYFNELTLNAQLTEAAQLQAEWMAKNKFVGHSGPTNLNGRNLFAGLGDRIRYFGFNGALEGEGTTAGGIGQAPWGWMQSDTHFRPWFNIGARVPSMGLGAAQDSDGKWYGLIEP